jgi:hypothetical protein
VRQRKSRKKKIRDEEKKLRQMKRAQLEREWQRLALSMPNMMRLTTGIDVPVQEANSERRKAANCSSSSSHSSDSNSSLSSSSSSSEDESESENESDDSDSRPRKRQRGGVDSMLVYMALKSSNDVEMQRMQQQFDLARFQQQLWQAQNELFYWRNLALSNTAVGSQLLQPAALLPSTIANGHILPSLVMQPSLDGANAVQRESDDSNESASENASDDEENESEQEQSVDDDDDGDDDYNEVRRAYEASGFGSEAEEGALLLNSLAATPELEHPTTTTTATRRRRGRSRRKSYCLCDVSTKNNFMARCSNEQCELQYFHLKCAGLLQHPRGTHWCCARCRDNASHDEEDEALQPSLQLSDNVDDDDKDENDDIDDDNERLSRMRPSRKYARRAPRHAAADALARTSAEESDTPMPRRRARATRRTRKAAESEAEAQQKATRRARRAARKQVSSTTAAEQSAEARDVDAGERAVGDADADNVEATPLRGGRRRRHRHRDAADSGEASTIARARRRSRHRRSALSTNAQAGAAVRMSCRQCEIKFDAAEHGYDLARIASLKRTWGTFWYCSACIDLFGVTREQVYGQSGEREAMSVWQDRHAVDGLRREKGLPHDMINVFKTVWYSLSGAYKAKRGWTVCAQVLREFFEALHRRFCADANHWMLAELGPAKGPELRRLVAIVSKQWNLLPSKARGLMVSMPEFAERVPRAIADVLGISFHLYGLDRARNTFCRLAMYDATVDDAPIAHVLRRFGGRPHYERVILSQDYRPERDI